MTTFLIIGLAFLAFELWTFFNTGSYLYYINRIKEISEDLKDKQIKTASDIPKNDLADMKEGLKIAFVGIIYLIWAIAGLFTSMSLFFIPLFGVMAFSYFGKKMFKSDKGQIIVTKIDAVLSIAVLLAIFSYHFAPLLGL